MVRLRVLLSEESRSGCVSFSRWIRKFIRVRVWRRSILEAVKRVVDEQQIDIVLPTQEQAWLFAAGAPLVPGVPVAVATAASF